MTVTYLIIIGVTVLLSAFFSASEMSFNSANKSRLKKAAEDGKKTAKIAYAIIENFTAPLSAILIGNNLVNIAASSFGTLLFLHLFNDNAALASVVSTVVITLVILIFAEIAPKVIARQHADKLARFFAIPIRVLTFIFTYIIPLGSLATGIVKLGRKIWGKDEDEDAPTVTEDELSSIIDTVEEEGVIDEEKSELLQSTLEFPDTNVEEIMTPRIDIVNIDIDDEPETIRQIIADSRYSRIPVYEDNIDNIIGVLNLNHYYKALAKCKADGIDTDTVDIRSLLIEPPFVYKSMKLPAALATMKESKMHLVVVTDEFGGTLGIVTMEDILEELVGDIWDESDEIIEMINKIGDNIYEVKGDMNIDDLFEEIEFDAEAHDFECEYSTVGGWAVEMLNDAPKVGDSFNYENLCIIVNDMDDMRVTSLTVLVTPAEEETEE